MSLSLFPVRWPLVGMVHLPPLPGSPRWTAAPAAGGALDATLAAAERDARALVEGGVDGLLVENYGDAPFVPGRVPPVTVASLAAVVRALVDRFDVPIGVNVLRNDGRAALAVAAACGAAFIRVNVLAGTVSAGEGILRGMAHALLRERRALGAPVAIWADLRVKHATPIAPRALDVEARELVERAGADVVILSGAATGSAPDTGFLDAVRRAIPTAPRVLGSGLSAANSGALFPLVDGAIVGSDMKADGVAANPVDPARVRALVAAVRERRAVRTQEPVEPGSKGGSPS
jgi:membrane complex biogenesis BtpA family protein